MAFNLYCKRKIKPLTVLFLVLVTLLLHACIWDSNNEKEEPQSPRHVRWGLRLQIGNYVLDSIFTPPDSELAGKDYTVSMDNICGIEPDCDTALRKGKIYGWDQTCFSGISFSSVLQGLRVNLDVDSVGVFDFSDLPMEYQGGVTYTVHLELREIEKCMEDPNYPFFFYLYFSLYNF